MHGRTFLGTIRGPAPHRGNLAILELMVQVDRARYNVGCARLRKKNGDVAAGRPGTICEALLILRGYPVMND